MDEEKEKDEVSEQYFRSEQSKGIDFLTEYPLHLPVSGDRYAK